MRTQETKSETGVEQLDKVAEQIREIADQVLEQRLGKVEPPAKEGQALPVADEQLLQVAGEFNKDVKRQLGLMLGAIEILLAGAEFLSCDTVSSLQEQRGSLQGGMQSQDLDEDEDEDEDEDAVEQFEVSDEDIEDIEKRLSIWAPEKQAAMLRKLTKRMPDKIREYEVEAAADAARDELLNWLLNNRSNEDAQAFFEQALVAAKEGNGVVALKASA